MRAFALALCVICLAGLVLPTAGAVAQPTVLNPMNVETFRVLQRVSRNAGWASTAYRNYLVGLFEGLLSPAGNASGDVQGRPYCLPVDRVSGPIHEMFEWLEKELNNVVAAAQPNDLVARIFVTHLTASYPCKG
jgi:hypothetical protein